MGHAGQSGERCVHTSAPNSMSARFHAAHSWPSSGRTASARSRSAFIGAEDAGSSIPSKSREATRRILTSSTAIRWWNWNEASAAAVYPPTPGRSSSWA